MKKKHIIGIVFTVLVLILSSALSAADSTDVVLKGKVHYLDKDDLTLAKKMSRAAEEFKKTGTGDVYFAGYAFINKFKKLIQLQYDRYRASCPQLPSANRCPVRDHEYQSVPW